MVESTPQPPYPLNEKILPLIDPEYVDFYNKYLVNQQQVHYQPISKSRIGPVIPGGGEPVELASTIDYNVERQETKGPIIQVRVFTPQGEAPASGWPVLLYIHGGGWVLGGIGSENSHCTKYADYGRCVVVSVDYRLAPEYVYPAAVDDTWEAYLWIIKNAKTIGVDITKFAVGGSSAGGNLSAILTHMVNERQEKNPEYPSLCFQLLIVPVMDNTATGETYESWKKFAKTPALPADKMLWYRKVYLPDESTWKEPTASPIFYPDESFKKCPPAYFALAGLDVLSSEGIAYSKKLEAAGVPYELKIYEGVPHPVMAMDGVLSKGKELVADCGAALKRAFYKN